MAFTGPSVTHKLGSTVCANPSRPDASSSAAAAAERNANRGATHWRGGRAEISRLRLWRRVNMKAGFDMADSGEVGWIPSSKCRRSDHDATTLPGPAREP